MSRQTAYPPVVKQKHRATSFVGAWDQCSQVMLAAVWFGLVTGVAEGVVLAFNKIVFRTLIGAGFDVFWMAPLADMILFSFIGLTLVGLAQLNKRLLNKCVFIFVFAFFQFLSVLLMFPRLHQIAVLTLASGLAVQTARLLATHSEAFFRFVQKTTGWVLGVVLAIAVGLHSWNIASERRAIAGLPQAPVGAPNVLLIVMDTVRAQNLSLYDYARPTTPQLEQLAKRGVVFERALATTSWTLPSHASMFTGHSPGELSTDWETPLDQTYPTLAEILTRHGYLTAGFVANTGYCSYEHGLNRGFVHYEDYTFTFQEFIRSSSLVGYVAGRAALRKIIGSYQFLGRKTAADINDDFVTWFSHKDGRPFFAFLNYIDAHEPYWPPPPFDRKFGRHTISSRQRILTAHFMDVPPELENISADEIQAEVDAYDGSIAYIDYRLGLLLEKLQKRGLLENTLVIITSDHGEEFSEHKLFGHSHSLYLPSLHVPLIISLPSRVPADRIVREPATLRDIGATIVDILNLGTVSHFPGNSLAGYWKTTPSETGGVVSPIVSELNFAPRLPNWFPVSKGNMKSIVMDGYHYIRNGDGSEELYNWDSDPWEKRDLASPSEKRLSKTLENRMAEALFKHVANHIGSGNAKMR